MAHLSALCERQLVVVTGKGGVGKSTVAACLGRALTARGRRVLLLEVDPRENVHRLFGARPSGGEILAVAAGLYLQNLRPAEVLDRLLEERVRLPPVRRRILASPIYRHFTEGAPGLKEMAVLWHARQVVTGEIEAVPEVDTVVLDAPATGHGLSLLRAPILVSEVIHKGPVGKMTREVGAWIEDTEAVGVVVVTTAEEMPVTESLELADDLERLLDRRPEGLVVNALYPPVPPGLRGDDAALRLWRRRRELNETELERLSRAWRQPDVELPLLATDIGPELLDALTSSGLAAALGSGGQA